MNNVPRYLAVGTAAYLLILAFTFPVARLVAGIETRVDGLSLRAVDGSLFAGTAGQLYLSGLDLGSARWSLAPLRLLLGRLEYRVEVSHPDYSGTTRLGVTLGGTAYGEDLDVQLDPSRLLSRYAQITVSASGTLRLQLDSFEPAPALPAQLTGRLDWQDAALSSPLEVALGDIAFGLERAEQGIEARVLAGGKLGADGNVLLLPGGRYRVDLQLRPDSSIDADIGGMLATVTRQQPDGSYQLRTSGTLQAP